MRNAARLLILLAGLVLMAAGAASAQLETSGPVVRSLRIDGVVDPFIADYARDEIQRAGEDDVQAVLLTIDTPGGLDSSMREIVQSILDSPVPVVSYVSPEGARAASAGTFILMASSIAAMAPGTATGAAHPVGVSGAIASSKATNDAAAYLRELAELRGRNVEWANDAVVDAVSASASEALELGVIDLIAPSVDALLTDIDGMTVEVADGASARLDTAGATVESRELDGIQNIVHAMLDPNLAFVFFWLGLALIVAEFFVPGGVLGVTGAVLFVFSLIALGTLPVQLVGVVLLVASLAFFVLELLHPGFGAPAIGGVICLVLGGWFLFDPSVPDVRVSPLVILPVAAFAVLFFAVVVRAAIRIRRRPRAPTRAETLVGREGRVLRMMNPTGVVLVGSEQWSAESIAGPIGRGDPVRVVEVSGVRLRVEPVTETETRTETEIKNETAHEGEGGTTS